MNKKQKKVFYKILISGVSYIFVIVICRFLIPDNGEYGLARLILYLIPYFILSWDIYKKSVAKIIHKDFFDEDLLVIIATSGALFIKEYSEAVAVILLYTIGELLQSIAVNNSRKSVEELMNICPDYANILKDGQVVRTDPENICIGQEIVIRAGEKIPLDCRVTNGNSTVDTSPLTGEHIPKRISEGSELISGCINGGGLIRATVTKEFSDSTVSKILELVESASEKKSSSEKFIAKFARFYTPVIFLSAILLAVIPSIIYGNFAEWISRACAFLVVSCPCALVISVPMSFFCGIGAASKQGILVKGSNFLETISKTTTVVFDKTGTITKGEFSVTKVSPCNIDKEKLLEITALAESYSNHPVADSIRNACKSFLDISRVTNVVEIPGKGVSAVVDGKKIFIGNEKIIPDSIEYSDNDQSDSIGTIVYVSSDNEFLGYIVISDTIKDNAKKTIECLRKIGIKKIVMLTGDKENVGRQVAEELGLDDVYCEMLPHDKVSKLEELLESESSTGGKLSFVGDGVNDAPVLMRSDVGIAMGGIGCDAAIEAADIIIMDDDIYKIPMAVKISRKVMSIVKQNITFALAVKFTILILGAFGVTSMWFAVFADVGVSVIAILNSMRALKPI